MRNDTFTEFIPEPLQPTTWAENHWKIKCNMMIGACYLIAIISYQRVERFCQEVRDALSVETFCWFERFVCENVSSRNTWGHRHFWWSGHIQLKCIISHIFTRHSVAEKKNVQGAHILSQNGSAHTLLAEWYRRCRKREPSGPGKLCRTNLRCRRTGHTVAEHDRALTFWAEWHRRT